MSIFFLAQFVRVDIFLYFCGAFWFEGSDVSEISRLIGKQVKVLYRPAAVSSEIKVAKRIDDNHCGLLRVMGRCLAME